MILPRSFVQPIKSAQVPLPFQKCSFRNINFGGTQIVRDKSIFRGKAIVQLAKPFFLNPHFHDQRLGSKSQAPSNVTSKLWIEPSTFDKGESSSQNHNSAIQKNLGWET